MRLPVYVYVARRGNLVKIGYSRDVRKRLHQLARGAPVELITVFATAHAVDAADLETALHDAFADQRDAGDWFRFEGRIADWCDGRRVGSWLDTDSDLDEEWPRLPLTSSPRPPVDF